MPARPQLQVSPRGVYVVVVTNVGGVVVADVFGSTSSPHRRMFSKGKQSAYKEEEEEKSLVCRQKAITTTASSLCFSKTNINCFVPLTTCS